MVLKNTISVMAGVSGWNIDHIHKEVTEQIVRHGRNFNFGGPEEIKRAREVFITLQLYGAAIPDLLDGEAPEGFSWGGKKKMREFQQIAISEDTNIHGHDYTYQQLVRKWEYNQSGETFTFDQLQHVKECLECEILDEIESNRNIGVLYDPVKMKSEINKPCWNWFQVRYMGKRRLSIRVLFRSHDYGTALWANASFILFMFNHFVVKPLGCHISELIIVSASAHIYDTEADAAETISGYDWASRNDLTLTRHRNAFK